MENLYKIQVRGWKVISRALMFTAFMLGTAFLWQTHAQNYWQIEATGYNEDAIANGNDLASATTTAGIDNGQFAFASTDWQGTPAGSGLPADGIINSTSINGLSYQIPSYDDNNTLQLTGVESGTLTLTNPEAMSRLYILGVSGEGASDLNVTLTFDDDSTQEFNQQTMPDWFDSNALPIEEQGFGRVSLSDDNFEANTTNPRLYRLELVIDSDNWEKEITQITFEKTNSGDSVLNIMALSGSDDTSVSYCEPMTTYSGDYLSLVSSESAESDINYSADSHIASYINKTATILKVYAGQQFELNTAYVGGTQTMGIWVDWDEDGSFGGDNPDERLALSNGTSPQSFDISIPESVENGEYRLRVRGAYDYSGNIVADGDDFSCNTQNYGTTVDFTLKVVDPPACLKPTDLVVEEVTINDADISWTVGDNEDEWVVTYGESGFDVETEGESLEIADNPNATLTDLIENTTYDFYVKAICSEDDESGLAGPMTFTTDCGIATIPYLLDFENADLPDLPNCTTRENNGIGNDWKTKASVTNFDGKVLNYSYHPSNPAGPANSWFYTQGIELEAGVNYDISYKYGNNSTTWAESMKVAYGTSPEEADMTNELADYPEIELNSPEEELITFSVDTDGIYYFGFNAYSIENQNQLYVDDIQIDFSPSCPIPSDMVTSDITEDSVDLSWIESADASQWEVIYGETGFDLETEGESIIVEDDPSVTLTDLSSGTSYDIYLKAICGSDDESELTAPITFTTKPEGGYCLPEGTNSDRYINNFSTTEGIDNISKMESGFSTGGYGNFMDMMVSQVTTQDVSFEADIVGGSAGFRIWVDWNQDGEFSEDEVAYQSSSYSTSHSGSFTVPMDADAGETRMRIVSNWSSSTGAIDPCATAYGGGEFEDYTFEVIALDDCADATAGTLITEDMSVCAGEPFTLEVEGDSNAADGLSRQWMSSTDGETWEDIEDATNSSYTALDGIEEETQYKYVVTCSEDDSTDETEFVTVSLNPATECYCEASASTVEAITLVNFGDIQNDEVNEDDGYIDNTDQSTTLETNEEYDIALEGDTNGTSYTNYFTVWIDWNQDGQFNAEDEMYEIGSIEGSDGDDGQQATGNIEVPANAELGTTRMRVIKKYGSFATDPCSNPSYGQVQDYTIVVEEGDTPSCPNPSDLAVENITTGSADVSWTASGDETQWEVLYGEAGFDTDTEGTSISVSDITETTITDLDADTDYDVYVRAVCEENVFSDWTGPETLTTDEDGQTICEPSYSSGCDLGDGVDSVFLDGDDGALDDSNIGCDGALQDKTDEMSVTLTPGETYEIEVSSESASDDWAAAFIDNGDGFEIVGSSDESTSFNGSALTFDIDIPANMEGEGVLRVMTAFGLSEPDWDACGSYGYGSAVDYGVTLSESAMVCEAPTAVEVTNVTDTTADVSWTAGADEDQWEVLYGEAGFDTDSEGESEMVEVTTYTIAELDPETEYDVYVRSVCGEDDFSDWTSPETFITEEESDGSYCEGDDFDEFGAIKSFSTSDGIDNIDNQNISNPLGYHDFTEMVVSQEAGESFTFTVDIEETFIIFDAGVAAYIDYNNDYEFDASEQVYISDSFVSTATVTLSIPENTDPGNYRLRIVSDWNNPSPDPCDAASSIHDYTLTVLGDALDCQAPTAIEVTEVTDTTADVSWTAGGDETQWEVLYGEAGFDTDSEGENVIVDETSYTIAELDPETEYDVYVRSVCAEDDFSDWTGPETFTTEEEPVEECDAPTDVEVTDVTETTAEVTWTPGGDELKWAVIYGESGFSLEVEDDYLSVIVLAPSHTLEELTPETDYDVYVYAICDEDEMIYSDQVGPITFTTDDLSVDSQEFNNFTYYPNPVENQLSLKAGTQIEKVEVFNLLGQNVISAQPNSLEAQIHTEALQSGVYLMEVSINGSQKSFRIVKK